MDIDQLAAERSGNAGCVLFIAGLIIFCLSIGINSWVWITFHTVNIWGCGTSFVSMLLMVYGGFKTFMASWELDEIEIRKHYGLF